MACSDASPGYLPGQEARIQGGVFCVSLSMLSKPTVMLRRYAAPPRHGRAITIEKVPRTNAFSVEPTQNRSVVR